ncbi:hypothetical protein SD70_00685 [Gordoniibacillus kamchatkensis]|uniref:Prepilin-type N-terminal cleavage/methylation domain-containing protein n=1 Tax=Gordoniibacillus kamchatkensis TaxID=1590651 RepID=A0ABR5ANJ6_9BACL|nr:type II secretion system protein [Paenibacillus sp. VKM B-2647]KIL42458.1 hypothetical protein SD70_00685 [Paenibacillus sp. VKM B-2647]
MISTQWLKKERGLTLIEVLAAITILGIIVTAFVTISGYTQLSFNSSDKKAAALRLAEQKLKEIRSSIPQDPPIPNINTQNAQILGVSGPHVTFNITVNETDLSPSSYPIPIPDPNCVSVEGIVILNNAGVYVSRLITVTVSWGGTP